MKKLVVFDLDGTLYKADSSFLPAVKRLLCENKIMVPPDDFLLSFIGEPAQVFYDWLGTLPINDTAENTRKLIDQYENEAIDAYGLLYRDVKQVLDWLKMLNYDVGLCSNATKEYLEKILNKFSLEQYFKVIKYPLQPGQTKSDMLAQIKEELSPGFAYMIGDRKHDFQAAKDNDFTAVAVTYGYGKSEVYEADYQIKSLWELEEIL